MVWLDESATALPAESIGIYTSCRFAETAAERRQIVTWGDPTSVSKAGVTLGTIRDTNINPAIWRLRRQIAGLKFLLYRKNLGLRMARRDEQS